MKNIVGDLNFKLHFLFQSTNHMIEGRQAYTFVFVTIAYSVKCVFDLCQVKKLQALHLYSIYRIRQKKWIKYLQNK